MFVLKNSSFLVFCIAIQLFGNTQPITINQIDSIKGDFAAFSIDNLGNIYISHQDVITKVNPDFDTLFSTSVKSHFPSFIQAVKNFRILTFDKERGIVQFFDNTLTPLSNSLNLYDLDLVQPLLVCESFNGNSFWVLDAGSVRLLKVDENFKIITEVENLSFLTEGNILPTQMFENNDLLYIVTANENVMVFDAFGTFIQQRNIKSPWISIYQNAMLQYVYPAFLFVDIVKRNSTMTSLWPLNQLISFEMTGKFIYTLTSSGLFKGVIKQSTPAKNK